MERVGLKSSFSLKQKFKPCFSSQYPIYLTQTNKIFCGRTTEDCISISVLDGESLKLEEEIQDDDFITSFVVGEKDSTIILATRNLLLKRLDSKSYKSVKIWKSCHVRTIQRMALNQQSTRLATGSGDNVVRLWHIGPKEGYTATCRLHNSMITLLSFHPTLPYLFSSSIGDHFVAVWNSETGTHVSSLEGHQSNVMGISFNSDENIIATCGRDKVIMIWSCPDFVRQRVIPTFESLESCVFLPKNALANHIGEDFLKGNSFLLTGGQWGCLRVWNPEDGRCLLEIKGPLDRTPISNSVSVSDDRHSVDYGLHSIVDLKLVNIQQDCRDLEDNSNFSPKLVLVRQSNHVEFYNPIVAKLTAEFLGDIGQVDQLCIAGRNRNYLILADASPHLKIFLNAFGLVSTEEESNCKMDKINGSWKCHLIPGGHTDVIMDLCVSSCGQWLASGSKDQSICLWHLVENTNTVETKRSPVKVDLIVCLNNAHAAHITAVCFDRTTTRLITASEDNILKVWKIQFDSLDSIISEWTTVHGAHLETVNSIDVSINNQLVATASRDKTVKIWKFEKHGLICQGVLQGHKRSVWSVCFSTREKIVLSASGDGDIKLWNLKDFSCLKTLEGHDQPVYKAIFLSEDKQILSCDQKGLIRLWNVAKSVNNINHKEQLSNKPSEENASLVFEAHDGRIWALALCPNETGFFTGGEDETLCYFEDVTKQIQAQKTEEKEDFIQKQQLLNNLLIEKKYSEALHLAVILDQPKRALDILQELILQDTENHIDIPSKSTVNPIQFNKISHVLDNFMKVNLSETSSFQEIDLIQRLVDYMINWNTRSRTAIVSQYILNWILTHWTYEELNKWPNFNRIVESLLPYTNRHYQRISRLEEQLSILDYLSELMNENSSISNLKFANNNHFEHMEIDEEG